MNSEETSRSYKPSLALYRPPNARSKLLPRTSTQQLSSSSSSSSSTSKRLNKMPIKSALKRSKSFGSTGCSNGITNLNEFNLSTEQINLIKRAIDNPNNLMMTQLMEIVSIICSKAMETSMNSYGLARICIIIGDKDSNQLFLESLINCCREWFNERDKLMKPISVGHQQPKQKWLAYVSFVTELYLNLKSKHRRVKLILSNDKTNCLSSFNIPLDSLPEENSEDENDELKGILGNNNGQNDEGDNDDDDDDDDGKSETSEDLFNLSERQSRNLAMLLYDCCQAILGSLPTSNSTSVDIECLLNVLRSVGRLIEQENNQRMDKTMYLIREAYLGTLAPKLSAMSLKSLLELIECRSSKWQFNQSQQIYYFPYTKPT